MPEIEPPKLAAHIFLHRLILVIMAFTSGAAVMVIEMAAIRILAPWFGNSLYTWTGLIGVILTAMSAGYYAGGWLADKKTSYLILSHLLAVAALFIFIIPLFSFGGILLARLSIILGPVVASLLMFAVPGFFLGCVPPYIIRLVSLLSADKHIGLSAGTVYMVSTIGSVLGTFASGFWLIPSFDIEHLFWFTGLAIALLACLGYFLSYRQRGRLPWQVLALVGAIPFLMAATALVKPPPKANVLFDSLSFYHRIRVEKKNLRNGDSLRILSLDSTMEGGQYEKSPAIPLPYQRYWQLAEVLCRKHEAALFLGGGAFKMPQAFLDRYPQAWVEVVEIDPAVVAVGRRFFRVNDYPGLHIAVDDARRYLTHTRRKYDFIFGDAYNGLRSVPAHLLTREFFQTLRGHLDEHGIFMINLVASLQGKNAVLFDSVRKTISRVFPETYVFALHPQNVTTVQNIIIVAAGEDLHLHSLMAGLPPDQASLKKLLLTFVPPGHYTTQGGYLLTDHFNPVEYLVAQTIK
jgi:spermidine synthase